MMKRETGIADTNFDSIFTGDKISLFGMVGEVVFECGAYGISFQECINWECIESKIYPVTKCSNIPVFCYNDNFISFWELLWNFNCEEDCCTVVEIVSNN